MSPDSEHLIELVTRPLADNAELRMSAEEELRKAVEARGPEGDEEVKDAVESLERADQCPRRGWWKKALHVVALVVSLPLIFHTGGQLVRSMGIAKMVSSTRSAGEIVGKNEHLSPSQQLLLYGDETAANSAERWRLLWDKYPDDPVYLAVYAGAYFEVHDELSPEILEAAGKIDPDNGWFLMMSAAVNADKAVARGKRSTKETKEGKAVVMTIRDEELLEESLAIIHQAAEKPRVSSYHTEFLRRQIPLLPPRKDWVSQVPLLVHAGSMTEPGIPLSKLANVFAAGAGQSAARGDVDGFRRIVRDWHAFVKSSAEGGETLIELLIAKATISSVAPNFRDAARTLGLEEDARYFEDLDQRMRNEREERDKKRRGDDRFSDRMQQKSSIFGGLSAPLSARQVRNPPPVNEAELRPARFADHALTGRALCGIGWTFLCLWLLVFVSAYSKGIAVTRLSRRMTDLLRPGDWILIVGGGVLLPTLWYLAITRLSPFSAREWSVTFLTFMPVGGQFLSFWLSMLILPWAIASGILSRRAAVFGMVPKFRWFAWVAAGTAMSAVPAFGAVSFLFVSPIFLYLPVILVGCSLLACLLGFLAGGGEGRVLRRATLARILFPAGVAGILVLGLLIPFHYAEEKRWIQQDRWGEITAEFPAMSRHEFEVAKILRKETLELLGDLP